ncbi:MAG TPA: helix-turn-helix transcriptional regulator [Lacipirellulaceae bacterium]
MGQSKNLRLGDVRAIFRLVGECRELGIDSTLWRQHMLTELLRLTGGKVAMGGPTGMHDKFTRAQPVPVLDVGWDGPREQEIFHHYMRDRMHLRDPAIARFGAQLATLPAGVKSHTRSRRQLAHDRAWYGSAAFCEYLRPSGVDDGMMSVVSVADGQAHGIALFRPPGERPFTARDRRLLDLFHAELAPLLLTDLAPPGCDPICSLSPRLRQVLACLLEGDSENQAATRLGITLATTHQYVKALYRRLNVNTRAELMARFVRFPASALLSA